jgi:hypothetical protein
MQLAKVRGQRALRATGMAIGLAACASVLTLSGGVASANKSVEASTVTVTSRAYSNGFQVVNPKNEFQCGVVRLANPKGYYRVVLQKLSSNPKGGVLQRLAIEARAGSTSRLPNTPRGSFIQYFSGAKNWEGGTFGIRAFGSGTIRISADGRSGSVNASLLPFSFSGGLRDDGDVHVTAHWACTSKIVKATS